MPLLHNGSPPSHISHFRKMLDAVTNATNFSWRPGLTYVGRLSSPPLGSPRKMAKNGAPEGEYFFSGNHSFMRIPPVR